MRKLLYIWILLPLCIACERDLMSYEGEEAIYFAVQSGHSYASEKDWPYMPYTLAEFGKVQEDTMVVNIKVMITGPEKDYPRPFRVVVNPDSTTAREGIDYRALVDEYTVEANRSYAYIPVLFYRQPEMKNDTVTLGLKLVANDHFSLTFKEFDKMEGFTSGSVVFEQFDATMHKILVTDIMPKPSQWIRNSRNCPSSVATEPTLMEEITKECRREFLGEGQMFFFYKRRAEQQLPNGRFETDNDKQWIDMSMSNYVIPLPDSETDMRLN